MPLSPVEIRARLEKVLADENALERSAVTTFKQFDTDQNGFLNFIEIENLLEKLCENMQLPPVDSLTLAQIMLRYDTQDSEEGALTLEDFQKMYHDLLLLIQEKYYPKRSMVVRRSFFISHCQLSGRTIKDVFKFQKKLGSGSFGEVHLVIDKISNIQRVVKTINKQQAALPIHQINAEINCLKSLDHPYIIKIFEVYEDYNSVYIVQENCAGGELMERIAELHEKKARFSEKDAADIMRKLLEAVTYCHEKRIAHKDLKPENIMFLTKDLNSPLKIIDFGVAEMFKRIDDTSIHAAGTALYMAPEVFQRRIGLKCDVWSLGCVMYLLLTGKLPFSGKSLKDIQTRVLCREPNFDMDCQHVSREAVDLMYHMLQKCPSKRLSCKRALTHPWFKKAPDDREYPTPEISANLKNYMRQSNLKNALINMMVHQMNVTGPQIQKLGNLFRTFDKDGNGVLTASELTAGLKEANWNLWDINRIIMSLDIDNSGEIDYTEFLSACYSLRETEINVIWNAFSKIDTDGDGQITTDEFIQVLLGGSSNLVQKNELEKMIQQIDKNGNGLVDWDEFLEYIQKSE